MMNNVSKYEHLNDCLGVGNSERYFATPMALLHNIEGLRAGIWAIADTSTWLFKIVPLDDFDTS